MSISRSSVFWLHPLARAMATWEGEQWQYAAVAEQWKHTDAWENSQSTWANDAWSTAVAENVAQPSWEAQWQHWRSRDETWWSDHESDRWSTVGLINGQSGYGGSVSCCGMVCQLRWQVRGTAMQKAMHNHLPSQ